MQLGLTIPLQKHQKIKNLSYGSPLDRRFCWDLHIITLHGRHCLLAVHASSRYTFTRYDLSSADWGDLIDAFVQGLQESLLAAGYSEEQVEHYLQQAGPPEYTKTHGRREVAFLNRSWDDVVALDYAVGPDAQHQPLLDAAVNALPRRCAGHEGLGRAEERFRLDLQAMG